MEPVLQCSIHSCFFPSSSSCSALKTTCLGHFIIWLSYSSMLKTWPKKRCHGPAKPLMYCGVREGIHSSVASFVSQWRGSEVIILGKPWTPGTMDPSWILLKLAHIRNPKWPCPLQSFSCKTWAVHPSGQKLALVAPGCQYHKWPSVCRCSGFCTWVWIKFHICIPWFLQALCQYSCYFSHHDHWNF